MNNATERAEPMKLAELKERVTKCRSMIGRMCSEGEHPRMSVPADPERDEDLYITDTLDKLFVELQVARAEVESLQLPAKAQATCSRCGGTGELYSWETTPGGNRIRCVDDCPVCATPAKAVVTDEQIDALAQEHWYRSFYSGRDGQDFNHRAFARAVLQASTSSDGVRELDPTTPQQAAAGVGETSDEAQQARNQGVQR